MAGITVAKAGAFGAGGAGVIGATGYGAYSLIQPKNIRDQLIWDKFELLGAGSESWSKLVSKYDTDSNKLDDATSLTGNNGEKSKDLQAKCQKILDTLLTNTEATNQANITKAKRWCIKESELLKGS